MNGGSNPSGGTTKDTLMRGYAVIGLHNPKDPHNLGATMRAAGNYNAAAVFVTGRRIVRHAADTMKVYRHIPLTHVPSLQSVIPHDCVPVAVDLIPGARNLVNYSHPPRAFYIFGPEDSTLGHAITDWCRDVIYIPTNRCMNLAATVNVVLYDRLSKSSHQPTHLEE